MNAAVTRQFDNGDVTTQSEGPLVVSQLAWRITINRMQRQGWKVTRRFFDAGVSATAFLNDGAGSTARIVLQTR